jgi:hypothetical protein
MRWTTTVGLILLSLAACRLGMAAASEETQTHNSEACSGFSVSNRRLLDFRFKTDSEHVAFSCVDSQTQEFWIGWADRAHHDLPTAWHWHSIPSSQWLEDDERIASLDRIDWAIGAGRLWLVTIGGAHADLPRLSSCELGANGELQFLPWPVTALEFTTEQVSLAFGAGALWLATNTDWLIQQDFNWIDPDNHLPQPTAPVDAEGRIKSHLRLHQIDIATRACEERWIQYDRWKAVNDVELKSGVDEPCLVFTQWELNYADPWQLGFGLYIAYPWALTPGDKQVWFSDPLSKETYGSVDDACLSRAGGQLFFAAITGNGEVGYLHLEDQPHRHIVSTLYPYMGREEVDSRPGMWAFDRFAVLRTDDGIVTANSAYQLGGCFGHDDQPREIAIGLAKQVDPRGAFMPVQQWLDVTTTCNDQFALEVDGSGFVLIHQVAVNPTTLRLVRIETTGALSEEMQLTLPQLATAPAGTPAP